MADETWIWEIRNPDGGSMGLELARGRMAPGPRVLAHSLPERADVTVVDEEGMLVARGRDLRDDGGTPMAELSVDGGSVRRRNRWPTEEDLGTPVILPGGEVGLLERWWNAEDGSEWRWSVGFHNRVAPGG